MFFHFLKGRKDMIILEITTGEQSQQRQQMNAEGVVIESGSL